MAHSFPVTIKKEARRTLKVAVCPEGTVHINAPHRCSQNDIDTFIEENKKWIIKQQQQSQAQAHLRQTNFKTGDTLLYLGQPLTIQTTDQLSTTEVQSTSTTITFASQTHLSTHVTEWCRKQATAILPDRLAIYSQQTGYSYHTYKIKALKSRWGSCSTRKNINLNWRLIHCPLDVIDYVIIHELCHLKEMNHSAAFWALVNRYCANVKECKQWLRRHQGLLI